MRSRNPAASQDLIQWASVHTVSRRAQSLQPQTAVHLVGPLVPIWLAERDNPYSISRVHLPTIFRLDLAKCQTAVRWLLNLDHASIPLQEPNLDKTNSFHHFGPVLI